MAFGIINLAGNFCETLTIIYFLLGRYKLKYNKIFSLILFVVSTLYMFACTNTFLTKSYLIIPTSLVYILLVQLAFNNSWFSKAINTIVTYVVFALSELIVGMVLTSLLELDVQVLQNTASLFFICTISSRLLSFILIYVFKKSGFNYNKITFNKYTLSALILPIASFLVLVAMLRCLYEIDDKAFHIITLIFSIILVVANIISIFIIDSLNELVLTKEKLIFSEKHISNQIQHYNDLYNYQNELKAFRHDSKNRLISLLALLRSHQYTDAEISIQKDLDWIEEETKKIVDTGNPTIDAIIQSKIKLAKSKNINIKVSSKIASEIRIDYIELGVILGNSLDNAIEACDNIPNDINKMIFVSLLVTEDRISILVKNTVAEDINTKYLTTSKSPKEHGYGIKSIKTIAGRHDGLVHIECINKTFEISINIQNY